MDEQPPSRERPPGGVARAPRLVKLADAVAPCIEPAVAKQGFAAADIVMNWADIVGARLAKVCEPIRMQRPPRQRDGAPRSGATLVVRVEGAFAVEVQHLASVLIERVNARLGWRCVEKIALRQGPVAAHQTSARRPGPAPELVK